MAISLPIVAQFGQLQTGALFRPAEDWQHRRYVKIEPVLSKDQKLFFNAIEIENGKPCYFLSHQHVRLQKKYERYIK